MHDILIQMHVNVWNTYLYYWILKHTNTIPLRKYYVKPDQASPYGAYSVHVDLPKKQHNH